jgi:hypothetical protein
MRTLPILLFLASILAAAPAKAQTLYGRVTDAADGSPVAAALVTALDGVGGEAARVVSGPDGRYELPLPAAGAYRVQVSRIGFRTGISPAVAIGEGERMGVDLGLRTDAVRLEEIEAQSRVTPPFRDSRARGFYERMDHGRGMYYTPEQIARLDRPRASELITTNAGVGMRGGRVWLGGDNRGCMPWVYVDGFRKPRDIPLDDLIAASAIWGIEIYRYAFEIPNDLPRDDLTANCGVVMIWTRHS